MLRAVHNVVGALAHPYARFRGHGCDRLPVILNESGSFFTRSASLNR